MKISAIRLLAQSLRIDMIDSPHLTDEIARFIESLEKRDLAGIFHLTFHAKYLEDLIESDSSWSAKIRKLCEDKKILIGPWYLTPNDYLANGESLVRNLYFGNKICYRIGNVMKVGFTRPCFDHNSQLPQIFNGFNIDTIYIPVSTSQQLPPEFIWEGSDGSKSLVVGIFLIQAIDQINYRILDDICQYILRDGKESCGKPVIILEDIKENISDDSRVQEIVRYLEKQADVQVDFVSFPDYFWNIKENLNIKSIRTLTRNVIPRMKTPFQESQVRCHRIIVKNSHAEQNLQFYGEPWDCIRTLVLGGSVNSNIDRFWKILLSLQASLYNCPYDDYQLKRMTRHKYLELIKEIDDLYAETVQKMLNHLQLPDAEGQLHVCMVNPLPFSRTQIVKVLLDIPAEVAREYIDIEDLSGNKIPCIQISRTEVAPVFEDQGSGNRVQYNCILELKNMPALGYKTYRIVPVRKPVRLQKKSLSPDANILENDFLRVTINTNGTFNVYSKETGAQYRNMGYFIDRDMTNEIEGKPISDPIDSRTQQPSVVKLDDSILLSSYKIEYTWSRNGIAERTKLSVILSLDRLSRLLDLKIDIVDKADNHQICYYFPINFNVDHVYSDTRFDIQDILPKRNIRDLEQYPVFLSSLVGICDEVAGFILVCKEIRAVTLTTRRKPHLAMTLLDKYNAHLAANGTTILNYSFAFYPYVGGLENGQIINDAYNKIYDVRAHQLSNAKGDLPTQMEFLSLSPSSLCFTALKMRADGTVLMRLFNPTAEFVNGLIRTHYPLQHAYNLSLEEYRIENIGLKDDYTVPLLVPPKKIVTVELGFKNSV
ncbi:MAG: hypothetical protein ACP5FZ_12010 [Fidelibacterota bacterium]